MIDYLADLLRQAPEPGQGRHIAREYLQARILEGLQRQGAMVPLAFHGGTALRFLYGLPRYSEDLDFALERAPDSYAFRAWLRTIGASFTAEGYPVELRLRDDRVVHSAFVRFPGLLHALGQSPHPSQVLAIKLEVDTRPPAGAGLDVTLVRRHVTLRLQHHDRASLLSGKLHAVLQRPFAKGRDLYDLLWYLSAPDWPAPNLDLLNHALAQTDWPGPALTADTWRPAVDRRLAQLDWTKVRTDVLPFLERTHEADLITLNDLRRSLWRPRPGE
jgi:hypothetical protein